MAIRDLNAVGLGELLGSVLSAVVEGQAAATASSLAFVNQFGLGGANGGDSGTGGTEGRAEQEPRRFQTVPIRYRKLDENQQPADFVLDVPLLAMVNIPTLTVKQAKISFTYDVITTTTVPEPETRMPPILAPRIADVRPVSLVGSVRTPHVQRPDTRETAGVLVEVTIESVPLPSGLDRILELTELAASEQVSDQ
jgi:hypothetical protein